MLLDRSMLRHYIAIVSDRRHSGVETPVHFRDLSPACGKSRFLDEADSKTTLTTE